jgi:hypothetical protein
MGYTVNRRDKIWQGFMYLYDFHYRWLYLEIKNNCPYLFDDCVDYRLHAFDIGKIIEIVKIN